MRFTTSCRSLPLCASVVSCWQALGYAAIGIDAKPRRACRHSLVQRETTRVDDATIEAGQRGDRRAQARILSELQDVWYRYCLSQLRNPDAAADATQETGLRFLRQLGSFRGDSQIQTWSLGIALNVVREMKRKRTTRQDDDQVA